MADGQEYLTYEEALVELGVDRSELNGLIREGRLEEQVVEGQTRFARDQVMAAKEDLLAGGDMESGETAVMKDEIEVEDEEETAAEEESREDFFDFSEALEEDFELEEAETVETAEEEEDLPTIELEEETDEEEEIVTAVIEPTGDDVDEAELLNEILEIEEDEEEAPIAPTEVADVREEEVTADITAIEEPEYAEPAGFREEEVELDEAAEPADVEIPTAVAMRPVEQASTWPTVVLVVALIVLALAAVFMVENTVHPDFSTPLTGWLPL